MWKMLRFSISVFLCIILINVQIIKINCKRSFVLIAPKIFDIGSKEKILVTVLDIDTPGIVHIKLLGINDSLLSETKEDFDKEGSKRIKLHVPSNLNMNLVYHMDPKIPTLIDSYGTNIEYPQFANAELQVNGYFGDYEFQKNVAIKLRKKKVLLFLNTDKPFYKAGQTVKFRVLVINSDLRLLKKIPVGSIWITNSYRFRMAQWMNVTFKNGFAQEEFKLPEEPDLGSWTLHAEIYNTDEQMLATKSFMINEYVLPTFDVKIIPPSNYQYGQKNVTWGICAKYSFGKAVQGTLLIKITQKSYYYNQPDIILKTAYYKIDGCINVTDNIEQNTKDYPSYIKYPDLILFAKVIESGTESQVNSTFIVSSTYYQSKAIYSISRKDSLQYFRVGIPFRTKLIVKNSDSIPVKDELIEVCGTIKTECWGKEKTIENSVTPCRIYKTDHNGEFVITIPPQSSNIITIDVEAKFVEESKLCSPSLKFHLIQWFSFTGHSIQIEPIYSTFECGSTAEFSVLYTYNEPEKKKLYYQVMSKGDIVDDGIITYGTDPEDLVGYWDETYLTNESISICQKERGWHTFSPLLKHVGKFTLKFNVNFKMSPSSHVVLYSITDEGNFLADYAFINMKPCFKNSVHMKFSEDKQFPGEKTIIKLIAEPRSVCSVGIVDKSVYLLQEGDVLSKSKLFDQLKYFDTPVNMNQYQIVDINAYCKEKTSLYNVSSSDNMEPLNVVDAFTAFSKAKLIFLSDLELETRPCKPSRKRDKCYSYPIQLPPPYPARVSGVSRTQVTDDISELTSHEMPLSVGKPVPYYDSPLHQNRPNDHRSTVRTYFPETWLWNVYVIGESGKLSLKEKLPDSITEWEGTAICVHQEAGLGISDPASIVAFQPFFTSLKLPYSVIRGETVPVIITVFNYLEKCLPIRIHIDGTDDYDLYNSKTSSEECICGGKTVTVRFLIKPKTLGEINITVSASTIKNNLCNNLDVSDISRSDTLTKSLIVEAEGFPKEQIENILFCLQEPVSVGNGYLYNNENECTNLSLRNFNVNAGTYQNYYDILIGEDAVKESERAFIAITGDIMGPTLEGLESLVQVPIGCGEQNMIKLVPNILVLDYLKSTNRLSEEIRDKALRHMRQGYIQERKYRHSDGSYSAFGESDPSGSLWLTAFVVRSFSSAARYIDIDQDELSKTRNWIISHQQENGCFPIIGMLHNREMKGGVGKEDSSVLTAYVLASLLLSGELDENVIKKALSCIQASNNTNNYALSIFAYTTSLIDEKVTKIYLENLTNNAVYDASGYYWENKEKSIAIEIASYVMLALLNIKDQEGTQLGRMASIARWLSLQRNSYGGFVSTQDTIMALEALAKYAVRINRQKLNMRVRISGSDLDKSFHLNQRNELLTQRFRVPSLPTTIEMEATGVGCTLMQMVLRYNFPESEGIEYFHLKLQSRRKINFCKLAEIIICTRLNDGQNESNMVVLEVKMVSGFTVVAESLESLLSISRLNIRRVQIYENQFNIYFDQLNDEKKCFYVDVKEELKIEDVKPANVKIYDYYEQEKMATVSYTINDDC